MAGETELERLVVRLVTDVKGYIGPIQAAVDATKQIAKEIDSLGTRLAKASQHLDQFSRRITMRVTAPILAATTGIYALGTSFEDEMSQIVGLVGVSRDQVNAWSEDILKLASEIGKSPIELAHAMFFVTSAGFRGAEAMDVLTMSAKGSVAGLGATAVVADAVTSAVNAYAKQNMTAARATDILTAAVREGKLEAESLAPVLGGILPSAAALNVSLENVAGVMAVMSRTGTNAAEASTSIQAILMTLQRPTQDSRDLLEGVGLSFAQLRVMAAGPEGLIGVIRTLSSAFKGNDEALAQIVPNIRALRGVMNALAQDASKVDAVMAGVKNSTGDMTEAFLIMMDSAGAPLRQTLAQLKTLLISLSRAVIPTVNMVLSVLNFVLKGLQVAWGILPGFIQETIVVIAALTAAIGPLLVALAAMISIMVSVVGSMISMIVMGSILSLMLSGNILPLIGVTIASLTGFLPILVAIRAGIMAYTLATKVATIATMFWQALMGPAGWALIVAGIAAATAAIVIYKRKTREAEAEARKAGDEAAEAMGRVESAAESAATSVAKVTSELETLREKLATLESPSAMLKGRWLKLTATLEARRRRLIELEKVMAAARWEIAVEVVKGAGEERLEMLRRSLEGIRWLFESISATVQELEGRLGGLALAFPEGTEEIAAMLSKIEDVDLRSAQEQFDALEEQVSAITHAFPELTEKAKRFLEEAFGETPMGQAQSEIDDLRFSLRGLEEGWDEITEAVEGFRREHKEAFDANETQVAEYRDVITKINAKKQAVALQEQYATPFEKAKKEIEDLNRLLDLLGKKEFGETYRRGIEDTMKKFREATKTWGEERYVSQGVETIRRGSVQEAILKQEHRIAVMGKTTDQTTQEKQLDALVKIEENTDPVKVTETPTTITIVPARLAGV